MKKFLASIFFLAGLTHALDNVGDRIRDSLAAHNLAAVFNYTGTGTTVVLSASPTVSGVFTNTGRDSTLGHGYFLRGVHGVGRSQFDTLALGFSSAFLLKNGTNGVISAQTQIVGSQNNVVTANALNGSSDTVAMTDWVRSYAGSGSSGAVHDSLLALMARKNVWADTQVFSHGIRGTLFTADSLRVTSDRVRLSGFLDALVLGTDVDGQLQSRTTVGSGSSVVTANSVTGTGAVAVMSVSPTFTGTLTGAAANFSGAVGFGTTATQEVTVHNGFNVFTGGAFSPSMSTQGLNMAYDNNVEESWIQSVREDTLHVRALKLNPLGGNITLGKIGYTVSVPGLLTEGGDSVATNIYARSIATSLPSDYSSRLRIASFHTHLSDTIGYGATLLDSGDMRVLGDFNGAIVKANQFIPGSASGEIQSVSSPYGGVGISINSHAAEGAPGYIAITAESGSPHGGIIDLVADTVAVSSSLKTSNVSFFPSGISSDTGVLYLDGTAQHLQLFTHSIYHEIPFFTDLDSLFTSFRVCSSCSNPSDGTVAGWEPGDGGAIGRQWGKASGDTLATVLSGRAKVTIGGCSDAGAEDSIGWARTGNIVTINFNPMGCTSNSTSFTITGIPSNLWPNTNSVASGVMRVVDNGNEQFGYFDLASGGTLTVGRSTISLITGFLTSVTTWTASGQKAIQKTSWSYTIDNPEIPE